VRAACVPLSDLAPGMSHEPRSKDADADRQLISETASKVLAVLKEAEVLSSAERRKHVLRRLDEIDGGLRPDGESRK